MPQCAGSHCNTSSVFSFSFCNSLFSSLKIWFLSPVMTFCRTDLQSVSSTVLFDRSDDELRVLAACNNAQASAQKFVEFLPVAIDRLSLFPF